MLEFTKVFIKGQCVNYYDIETIMNCKNIEFGYVNWDNLFCVSVHYNIDFMNHITNNIINVNAHDNDNIQSYTFFTRVIRYGQFSNMVHNMLNNGYINDESFEKYHSHDWLAECKIFCKCCPHKKYDKLVNYLTKVSLNKFKGYYNIEKYYDMIHTMLLILKVYPKLSHIEFTLPSTIIKHLIIPFIYR